jgi:hypothetical protein
MMRASLAIAFLAFFPLTHGLIAKQASEPVAGVAEQYMADIAAEQKSTEDALKGVIKTLKKDPALQNEIRQEAEW